MAVIIINPNSTRSMTDAMLAQARRSAPDLDFEGWTSREGPQAIQGPADGEAARVPLLKLVEHASSKGADGIIIGCFDDTALEEATTIADCPVIGIGQASYHYAALRNWRFSVVTTLSVSMPIIQSNIERHGFGHVVSKVRASEIPVLELETNTRLASKMVAQEALVAEQEDGVSAIILGCAGMVEVVDVVRNKLSAAVIDPVECAAQCMLWVRQID
ncbi:MAG: aspartate/glutamate racemase family protein [Rhodobacteraceae bacterium]|nr:aspartate/glutamate racemase family protein [Paracoccaceae bacterium]